MSGGMAGRLSCGFVRGNGDLRYDALYRVTGVHSGGDLRAVYTADVRERGLQCAYTMLNLQMISRRGDQGFWLNQQVIRAMNLCIAVTIVLRDFPGICISAG
jgi:hypothetical protein